MNSLDQVIEKLKDLNGIVAPDPLEKISRYCKDNKDKTNALLFYVLESYLWDIKEGLPEPLTKEISEDIFIKFISPLINCLKTNEWEYCLSELLLEIENKWNSIKIN